MAGIPQIPGSREAPITERERLGTQVRRASSLPTNNKDHIINGGSGARNVTKNEQGALTPPGVR